ncbi:MAG: hypothetical protein ACRD03_13480, partial [Acidimicrobiales bacterium]
PVRGGAGWRALAAVVVVGSGCAPGIERESELPASPPEVVVTLTEYRFELSQDVPAGRVVFRLRNAGEAPHRPALLPLGEELPPLEQQLRGQERSIVNPYAGTRTRVPGATGSFAVDLVPGTRYGLICFLRDEDGSSHALKGMHHEFRTPPTPG